MRDINYNNPLFNEFYNGRASTNLYLQEIGMERAAYPSATLKQNFKTFKVVTVRGSDAEVQTFENYSDLVITFPKAVNLTKTDAASFKDDDGNWVHLTTEFNEDGYKAAVDEYQDFQNALGQHFKDYLIREVMPSNLVVKGEELCGVLYREAYERGHAEGYSRVAAEFEELCDLAEKIIEASG